MISINNNGDIIGCKAGERCNRGNGCTGLLTDIAEDLGTGFVCGECGTYEITSSPADPINPSYYKKGKYETWDVSLEVVKNLPPQEAICVFNVLKYVIRYKEKNGLQDLKKSQWYLNKLVGILENDGVSK